jgi:hypothetical protein
MNNTIIRCEAQTDAVKEALEVVEAHLNNFCLPSYNTLLLALEQIAGASAWDDGYDPMAAAARFQEIAKKAIGQ